MRSRLWITEALLLSLTPTAELASDLRKRSSARAAAELGRDTRAGPDGIVTRGQE